MMGKKSKRVCSLFSMMMLLVFLFVSCNVSKKASSNVKDDISSQELTGKKFEKVTLNIMLRSDPVQQYEKVLEQIENATADKLNIKMNWIFTPGGDYLTKLQLMLTAKQELDSVFDAPWLLLGDMANKGLYADIGSYFNNDQYPGLKKAFSTTMIDANRFNGKLYGIPLTRDFSDIPTIIIRGDLREKYGLPEIKDIAGLEVFFDKVLQNEKGMIPVLETNLQNNAWSFMPLSQIKAPFDQVTNTIELAAGFRVIVAVSKDGKSVLGAYFPGDTEEVYKDFPNEWKKKEPQPIAAAKLYRKWYEKGYFEKDIISQKDGRSLFEAGKFAAAIRQGQSSVEPLQRSVPGAKGELVLLNEYNTFKPGLIETSYIAGNFQCIPSYSKNTDRMMMFYDWMFSGKENHSLVELGIKGVHWVETETNGHPTFSTPPNVDPRTNYVFSRSFTLTWNPLYKYLNGGLPEMYYKIQSYLSNPASYYKSPVGSFKFNDQNVKEEMAKVVPVFTDEARAVYLGIIGNTAEEYKKINEKARKLGLEKIRLELINQLNVYLQTVR